MARSKGGLQKNIRSIFEDAAMPDDIHVMPDPVEAAPESTPVVETSKPEDQPHSEAMPVQETPVSALDTPVPQPQPQSESSQAAPDASDFSDPTIEGQMKKQKCAKGFSCYKSGLKDLCRARLIRRGKVVQCLEPKKKPCDYRLSTLFKRLCQCPIRIRLAKKHKK